MSPTEHVAAASVACQAHSSGICMPPARQQMNAAFGKLSRRPFVLQQSFWLGHEIASTIASALQNHATTVVYIYIYIHIYKTYIYIYRYVYTYIQGAIYRIQLYIYIHIYIYILYIEREKRDPSNACMGSVCVRASDM